jgi:DnaK suppressor protein
MTSEHNGLPLGPAGSDVILMALFESRLRERARHLAQLIQSQRKRLTAARPDAGADASAGAGTEEGRDVAQTRLRLTELALAAVQEAEQRLGRGSYGLCETCQEPISWDELLQFPEQTSCEACRPFAALATNSLKN